jgi:hypothetical protein
MKKKVYEIDGESIMLKGLEEFKKELYSKSPEDMHELFEIDMVNSLMELCYKAGFQDGAIDIGEMIQDIIKGEVEGPNVNPN